MAVLQIWSGDLTLVSRWQVHTSMQGYRMSDPSTDEQSVWFSLSGIPAGASIQSAVLSCARNTPATGAAIFTVNGLAWDTSIDATGAVQNAHAAGGVSFTLRFKANGAANAPAGSRNSVVNLTNLCLTVTYDLAGGGTTPPPPPPPGDNSKFYTSATELETGQPFYIGVTDNADYFQRLSWSFGPFSGEKWVRSGQPDSLLIQAEHAWFAGYPAASALTLTAQMAVYRTDETWVRTEYLYVRISLPANIGPTIGSFAPTRIPGFAAAIPDYVQGYSSVKADLVDVAGQYGATITEKRITGMGRSVTGDTATFELPLSGEVTLTATVRDSRGRVATRDIQLVVEPYSKPALDAPEAYRADSDGLPQKDGTFAAIKSGATFASVNGHNPGALEARVYPRGGVGGDWQALTPGVALLVPGLTLLSSYVVEIKASDLLNSYLYTTVIASGRVALSFLDRAAGGAVGMYATKPGVFESAWPVEAPNLHKINYLDNWDFRSPINQRGLSGAVSAAGYILDRWILVSGTVTINASSLALAAGTTIEQRIQEDQLLGQTVAVSVLLSDGSVKHGFGVMPVTGPIGVDMPGFGSAVLGVATGYQYLRLTAADAVTLHAAKLEDGDKPSIAYDRRPDYRDQLRRCHYYLRGYNLDAKAYDYVGLGRGTGSTSLYLLPLGDGMRIVPTVTYTGTLEAIVGTSTNAVSSLTVPQQHAQRQNALLIECVHGGASVGAMTILQLRGTASRLYLSAEL